MVEILCDEDRNLVGIVFQDGIMKSTFAAFPEVLLMDATYKLTDLHEDACVLEIVCVFVTVLETEESKMVARSF